MEDNKLIAEIHRHCDGLNILMEEAAKRGFRVEIAINEMFYMSRKWPAPTLEIDVYQLIKPEKDKTDG